MYHYEMLNIAELRREAKDFSEEKRDYSLSECVNIYLKSKPGTWRLISHAAYENLMQFIWYTGE